MNHTLRLPASLAERLDAYAAASGSTKSEVIRAAVDQYLGFHAGRGANPNRVAELCEFNQLVLDLILRRDFPDKREAVMDALNSRLDKYHVG